MDPDNKLRLDYAWNWFQYHASQRFAAFNFFLILVGALTIAYGNAFTHHSRTLGTAIALLGALIAVGFSAIDVRNDQLVDCGRTELKDVEPKLGISITENATKRRHGLVAHRVWFRLMQMGFAVVSLAAAIWAAIGDSFGH
jgi:hypothetical protein